MEGAADDTRPEAMAAQMNNAFAIGIYPHFAETKGNLCFSPYSVENALAMAWAGARGETARQLAAGLHLGEDRAADYEDFGALVKSLNAEQAYQLSVANSVWLQQGVSFHGEFLKTAQDSFGASLNPVDFQNADAARQQINDWVTKATQGKIDDIIPPGGIDSSTRLALADAIYFKAAWHARFEPSATKDAPFKLAPGKTKQVKMMHLQGLFSYGAQKTMQILDLPYFSRKISMIIFLPTDADGLSAFESSLTDISMTQMTSWVKPQLVNVYLPKFKFASDLKLEDMLQAIGVTDAFSPDAAKFTGIASGALWISAIFQKSFIGIDEDGTEAAAATVAVAAGSAAPAPGPPPFLFRADRPFTFMIRHNDTGAILFMGHVTNP